MISVDLQFPCFLKIGELFIIVEYCRFGNLQTYLVNSRNNYINQVDEFGELKAENGNEVTSGVFHGYEINPPFD
jgi:hypothetical protein